MKLADMKRPKLSKKELKTQMEIGPGERENYPYGLRLRLDKDEIDKIPALKKAKAGERFNIRGVGKVVAVRTTDAEKDKQRHNIEIQVQKIGFASKDDAEEAFNEE